MIGRRERIRTSGPHVPNVVLYQAELLSGYLGPACIAATLGRGKLVGAVFVSGCRLELKFVWSAPQEARNFLDIGASPSGKAPDFDFYVRRCT